MIMGRPLVLLREIGSLARGKSRHRPRYDPVLYGGRYPFIQTGDIKNANRYITTFEQTYNDVGLSQSRLWPKGTLCITIAANIAETAILGMDACFPDSVVGFTPNTDLCETLYVYYYLQFYKQEIQKLAYGTVQDNINLATFDHVYLPLPPLEVQRRIVDILGSLDDKIELNNRMNETLEQMAITLYKHWFIDSGSSERVPVSELIEINPKISVGKRKWIPYVDMKALSTKSLSVSDANVVVREYTSGSKFQNGDTLFARITPCLENGKTAYVDFLMENSSGFGSTEFLVLRAKFGVSPAFVYCTARSPEFRNYAIKSMVGTSGRQRVQAEALLQFELPSPEEESMNRYSAICQEWFQQIRSNTVENLQLANLRDYLLPRLLSGDIQVGKAEERVKEAMAHGQVV